MTSNQSAGESAPLAPSYIVQIDEIREHGSERKYADGDGLWWPSPEPGAIILLQGQASGTYWYCNGSQISRLPVGSTNGFPGCLQLYKAFSTFYVAGRGFRIMRGDATNPYPDESWHCLQFLHDGPHSLLTNVGDKTTLRYQQSNATWPAMLLPNIYHGKKTSAPDRGKLLGDLPIFLALVALSMPAQNLQSWLPEMFGAHIGGWRVHGLHAQWEDMRGVVVKVYQVPNNWPGASPREDLRKYEDGNFYGRHYYQH